MDTSFPIFTRKEIETKRIRKEIKTIISRLNHFIFPFQYIAETQQTRNVIVTFSIGFKLVTLNLTFGKRLANVHVLCRHIFMCNEIR